MRRPTLSNQSQMLLTGVLVVFIIATFVVDTLVTGLVAVALAVLLLVSRTTPSDDADKQPPRRGSA